jgi:PEP-CTERM motif
VVKKNHPRKREGGSGAVASFLLSQYLGEQRNDGQPNRPSEPESHSLFSALSGLKMGTSSTGPGSTAPFIYPGYFSASTSFLIQPDAATPAQSSYTIMVVAYNGADYASSTICAHSAAVYVLDAAPNVMFGADIGTFFPANTPMFGIYLIPEPGTLALAGLGGLALWFLRRRQS